jgi:hypothetical protein
VEDVCPRSERRQLLGLPDLPSSSSRGQRRFLLQHTRILQHVRPLAARACVRMLQVLAKMVRAEELLARVALAELVCVLQMSDALVPVLIGNVSWRSAAHLTGPGELFAAISARVGLARARCAVVEGPLVTCQCAARPAVAAHVQAVLVPLCLVLVLESAAAEGTFVLLLGLMRAVAYCQPGENVMGNELDGNGSRTVVLPLSQTSLAFLDSNHTSRSRASWLHCPAWMASPEAYVGRLASLPAEVGRFRGRAVGAPTSRVAAAVALVDRPESCG